MLKIKYLGTTHKNNYSKLPINILEHLNCFIRTILQTMIDNNKDYIKLNSH